MPRARKGAARRQSKNRWLQKTKGNRGARRNQWRKTKETVVRAGVNAYGHRKDRKRDYRQLWITRINAACRAHGLRYSRFMHGLLLANVALNRKMLAEMAIHDEAGFAKLVEIAKGALTSDAEHAPGVAAKAALATAEA
ncbi:MAG: 50S ribosomal protein L20 [Planctomycetota bacterium]